MTQTWNKNKIRKEMGYGTWGKGGTHDGGKVEGMVGKGVRHGGDTRRGEDRKVKSNNEETGSVPISDGLQSHTAEPHSNGPAWETTWPYQQKV